MLQNSTLTGYVVLALLTALVVSFLLTPAVKSFAYKVGAVDVPKDNRRMHNHPIPRLGGLAIFVGFVVSVLLFAEIDRPLRGILLGSCLIVAVGVVANVVLIAVALAVWEAYRRLRG